MTAILVAQLQRVRSLPWWALGLACALVVGAALRLVWGLDIEYKADEVWTFAHARHMRDSVIPKMVDLRAYGDKLETLVADDLWPLPTYREMLFIK